MKKILTNKYFPWILLVMCLITFFKIASCQNTNSERLDNYNRQLQGQLSNSERELQNLNAALGISKSELLTQQELYDRLQEEKEEIDKEFEKFRKEHDLIITSKDKTIAELKQQINGGITSVVVTDDTGVCEGIEDHCVIMYAWKDELERFKLQDPNIFEKNNELFESNQIFKIYGEVYQERNGFLKIRRLVLREVYKDGDEYKPITGGKAEIIDSKFEYTNAPDMAEESTWRDLFRLRAISSLSLSIIPAPEYTAFSLGLEFFHLRGVGINTQTVIDFKDAKKIGQKIGVSYSPTIMNKELNFAAGLHVGTPFYRVFNEYFFGIDLIFYLHE